MSDNKGNKIGFTLDKGARKEKVRIEDANLKNETSKDASKEKGDGLH